MTPTPPNPLDAAASRLAPSKVAKSLANEFAALLAQFDNAASKNSETAATTSEERQANARQDATDERVAALSEALIKGAKARPSALREAAASLPDGAERVARLEMRVAQIEQSTLEEPDALPRLKNQIVGKAQDFIDTARPAVSPQGLQTIPAAVAKLAADLPLSPLHAPPVMRSALAETAKTLGQRLTAPREPTTLSRNAPLPSPDVPQGPHIPSDEAVPADRSVRERFALRLGPLAERIEQSLSRGGGTHQGDADAKLARSLGQFAITRHETHLAPIRQPAAIADHVWRRHLGPEIKAEMRPESTRPAFTGIVDQISQALDGMRNEAAAKMHQATHNGAPTARSLSPVKIVEISLQPASLGAISITMRLTGTGLRVTVSATTRATAEQLREDRDALSALVAGAGYHGSEIIVTHRPRRDSQFGTG